MTGLHVDVLKILPRLSSTNSSNMLRRLGDPSLLLTAIKWTQYGDSARGPGAGAMVEFFLRSYTFDLSVRDEDGDNALILAVKTDAPKLVRLFLGQREDLLNSQDDQGRTPLSWATEGRSVDSIQVLLHHKDIQLELIDHCGRAPIDHLVIRLKFETLMDDHCLDKLSEILPVMIKSSEHGLNRLDHNGHSTLHALIDRNCIWKAKKLEGLPDYETISMFTPLIHVPAFRRAISDVPVSTAEIRFTPCECGLGTMFLAMSTGYVELVEALLEFYPDLVNDICFDESSPLEWASCIEDKKLRQSMIDFVHSKNPVFKTYRTGTPVSDINESDPGEAQKDYSFTDVELHWQGGHIGDETDDG